MLSTEMQSKQHIFCGTNALNLLLSVARQKHITGWTSVQIGIVASCTGNPANQAHVFLLTFASLYWGT